ncbi:MAG: hypothetical protein ABGX23_05350 [Nautiliaceae bacterium]
MRKLFLIIVSFVFLFGEEYNLTKEEIKDAYYQSYKYEKMGDYKDAIKVLIPVYKLYTNGYTINLRLGWLFYLAGRYENAIKHYNVASMVYPYAVEPKLGLMRVYNAMGKYNNSVEIGGVIIRQIDYYNFYGNYYDAIALMGLKMYKEAIKIDYKMLSLYPTSVLYLVNLGINLYNLKAFKKAKSVFENVLILDPTNVSAKYYLKLIK